MNNYSSDEEKLISWFQVNYKNILGRYPDVNRH